MWRPRKSLSSKAAGKGFLGSNTGNTNDTTLSKGSQVKSKKMKRGSNLMFFLRLLYPAHGAMRQSTRRPAGPGRAMPRVHSASSDLLEGNPEASRVQGIVWAILVLASLFGFTLFGFTWPVFAEQLGSASGLPIPRYVSLKSDRVNLHEGPAKDHRTIWVFQRAGLPVEITAEFETWRKVRDSDGAEGWVLHSLLSGRRTALVAPWKKNIDLTLYEKPNAGSSPLARLEPNVLGNVRNCDGNWCRIRGEGFDGYIQQSNLWGVYPNEKIE
jgi:SH3-like domain-containing protein